MARTKKTRLIKMAPSFSGFKPQGLQTKPGPKVIINFEEYEALNLCDYELLTQEEASKLMNISRPTFTRIYESVRRKVAKAFMDGCNIQFEGGSFLIAKWYHCKSCNISFSLEEDSEKCCPLCKSKEITQNK